MFLLNACGSNNNSSNIDAQDAARLQTGRFSGKMKSVPVAAYDSSQEKVITKAQPQLVNTENTVLEVDWDNKKASITLELLTSPTTKETIILEGNLNSEGIFFLKNKETTNANQSKVISSITCVDNECKNLAVDVGARVAGKEAGKTEFIQEQFEIRNPNPAIIKMPSDQPKKEVTPVGPGINGPSNTPLLPVEEPEVPIVRKPLIAKKKLVKKSDEELTGFKEPGTPTLRPTPIREEMIDSPKDEEVKIADYSESQLFPYNLGEKYKGKAMGFYSTTCKRIGKSRSCAQGALVKGIDVAIDGTAETEKRIGYESYDRGDKNFYGSGLLVKTVEEAGKIYDSIYNGETFKVNDLSKLGGGKISPHASHQNGLDIDVSIPKNEKGGNDYKKAWDVVKAFVQLGFVDVIFLNKAQQNLICKYLKNSTEKDYQDIFKHFYIESGHTKHMHVRLKCTNHNIGCTPAEYMPSQYGTCQ